MSKSKDIIIGVIYKPSDVDMELFTSQFWEILEAIQKENKMCYILGDYKINLLNNQSHHPTRDFINTHL